MFLGLLVPGAIILILAGLAAENGAINYWYVCGLAIVATIIGDTVSYGIGLLGWTRLLEKSGMSKMIERVREPMETNSTWIILSYHLAGYSRVVGPAAAGIFRLPFRRWAPLDYAGGTIWVLLYSGIGVALGLAGVEFGDTKRTVNLLEYILLAIFAIAVAVAFAKQLRDKGKEGGPPPGGPTRRPATVIIPVDEQ
jgi:membrane protein DedA with SNARE-associated domain